ncbi:SDR family NAD(P)-dependent oxidoreductase [Devosia ginsengisoli]|uniref:SDR family NAD(P)-dependent oxidoreductase n=1 Tax=Devosia ginsengisoli TaxID=400770 RepID=UPI0026F13C33|nr:SDR family oxidoreductase [Devosia ginsengisoli]MCR6672699.1 SDR family oxidoreductase [Devosia ginsengisoli]
MLLKDRTAVVYGGSGAVGGAVARAFAREGARVFLAARGREGLEAVAEDIRRAGGRADIAPVDATDQAAVTAHLAAIVAEAGPVQAMFNGVSWDDTQGELLADMPLERMLAPVRTALTTWFHTGTTVARHMGENGGGVILGITANVARWPQPYLGGFGVTCAAVENYLRQLGMEHGPQGVRVCWVRSPGSPDAPGVREAWQLRANELGVTFDEIHREFAKDTPLRRVTALAQVADAAVLLASDLAAGMTATMANATGGAQID